MFSRPPIRVTGPFPEGFRSIRNILALIRYLITKPRKSSIPYSWDTVLLTDTVYWHRQNWLETHQTVAVLNFFAIFILRKMLDRPTLITRNRPFQIQGFYGCH